MNINNPLFDLEFLDKLFLKNEREIYARITSLNLNEEPVEYIEGRISDGTINVDGSSTVRRTCSLTMTAQEININEFYWGIKNKFKLEIGLKNLIDSRYPDIIWFKQGIYVITEFNTSQSTNKWEIKIQGKDKMCLLNGDLAGHFMVNTNLGQYEDGDTKEIIDLHLKEILYSIVCVHGKEPMQNIIINDLDDVGKQIQQYNHTEDAYLYREAKSNRFKNLFLNADQKCYYKIRQFYSEEEYRLIPIKYSFLKDCFVWNPEEQAYEFDQSLAIKDENKERFRDDDEGFWFIGTVSDECNIRYDKMVSGLNEVEPPTIIRFNLDRPESESSKIEYHLTRMKSGDLIGYRLTDLTYAGDFIMSVGETFTAALDKIKNMLPNFEYYYDIDGRFVFQQIKDKIDTPWNSVETNKDISYSDSLINTEQYCFSFVDSKLISSFANNPKITDIKNDYVVWGSYDLSGTAIPLHMRYAIDVKPNSYKPIRPLKEEIIKILQSPSGEILSNKTEYKYYDAPEVKPYNDDNLIKITEKDIFIYGQGMSEFTIFTPEGNKLTTIIYPYFASKPYVSSELDWRELIYQMALDSRRLRTDDNFLYYIADSNPEYSTGYTGYEQYYTDLELNWRQIYDPNPQQFYDEVLDFNEVNTNNLYIKNYYRELEYDDFDTVTYDNLYVLNKAKSYAGEESSFTKLYPFAGSQAGNLEIGAEYYTTKDGKWKPISVESEIQSPVDVESELYKNYYTLNNTSFKNIYIKNVQQFKVLNDSIETDEDTHLSYYIPEIFGGETLQGFYVPYYDKTSKLNTYAGEGVKDYLLVIEKKFESILNYLKDLSSLLGILTSLQPYGFVSSDTYHLLINTIENGDFINKASIIQSIEDSFNAHTSIECQTFLDNLSNEDFISELINSITNSTLKEEVKYAIEEQMLYPTFEIEEKKYYYQFIALNERKEELKELIHDLYSQYYIKDSGYIKYDQLSDKIKEQYFSSKLDSYYFASHSFLYEIERLAISETPSQKISFLSSLINILNNYVSKIVLNNDNDINEVIWDELSSILQKFGSAIKTHFSNWVTGYIYNIGEAAPPVQHSCLVDLDKTLQERIQQELDSFEKCTEIDFPFMMTIYRNMIQQYNVAIQGIENGYNQNKEVLGILNSVNELSEENLTIDNVKTIFSDRLTALSNITAPSSQTQCSMNALRSYINDLESDEATEDSITIASVMSKFERQLYRYILALKQYMGIIEEDDEEEEYSYSLSYTLSSLSNLFTDFRGLAQSIKNLNQLLIYSEKQAFNSNDLNNVFQIIKFIKPTTLREIVILKQLYNNLISTDNLMEQYNFIQEYINQTVVFQTSLVREDTNNFNHYTQSVDADGNIIESTKLIEEAIEYYYGYYNYKTDKEKNNFWSKDLEDSPHLLTFWFDFLNPEDSEIAKYSVPAIGTRTKAVKADNNIPAIHYKDIPEVIFQNAKDAEKYERQDMYLYISLNEAGQSLFKNYPKGKSAKEQIDDLLYQHSYCTQTVTIQSIPVYHLQPNNRVYIRDDKSSINGEYIINKLSIPLNFKKMMSINAIKVMPNIS